MTEKAGQPKCGIAGVGRGTYFKTTHLNKIWWFVSVLAQTKY